MILPSSRQPINVIRPWPHVPGLSGQVGCGSCRNNDLGADVEPAGGSTFVAFAWLLAAGLIAAAFLHKGR